MLNFIAVVQVLPDKPDVTCVERTALGPCSTHIYIYLGRLHMKRIKMLSPVPVTA